MGSSSPARTVWVEVQPRRYPVIIHPGGLASLGAILAEHLKAPRAFLITDRNVGLLYADQAAAALREAGFEPTVFAVEPGESSKSLQTAGRIYDALAAAKIDRACPAVSLGGGVVGDLTGFVAATWLRGIPFAQCSTTVEANVDASVGGKTAVNHASGKNMIGAFYQPQFVLIDPDTLRTLSERDYRAGLAESIKHAVVRDADFFDWHERHADEIRTCQVDCLPELFERNVRVKAEIVAQDEREITGLRALLNFGHTVGHAIESAMARRGRPWRHGEAVAAGMVAAAEIAVAAGRLDRAAAERIVELIRRVGLPIAAPLADAHDELWRLIEADKKVSAGRLRFVLADAIGRARLYDDVQHPWIQAGIARAVG
ncbi:MAG TPA: 3-dehydroquinate synthase [Phycisphaerae bacterium]|nr:3-dehydroquinate synthase [Phycisphaerae bacterium]